MPFHTGELGRLRQLGYLQREYYGTLLELQTEALTFATDGITKCNRGQR